MKQFNVFYSWQSDLPGNDTKWFINSCIEEAVEKCNMVVEGFEIIADRDTKGKTGSPNISQTIFEKIDSCDLFIADVSIVNSYAIIADNITEDGALDIDGGTAEGAPKNDNKKNSRVRYTPNPNVLIELGYAVKHMGWEKVICFINTDYGTIEQLPFDLDHQRVTDYSLIGKNKDSVKKYLRSIIVDNIIELSKQNGSPKKGKSYHLIGTYNPENKTIDADLVAYDVRNYCWIEIFFDQHKETALKLIEEIKSMKLPMPTRKKKEIDKNNQSTDRLKELFGLNEDDMMIDYSIGYTDRENIINLSSKYLNLSSDVFDESFFNVGNLRIQSWSPVGLWGGTELQKSGTDDEKEKDNKIVELNSVLIEIQQLDLYLKTFDDVLLFPLAIENISPETDNNIEVTVKVSGDCDVIAPTVEFINPEIREAASIIYQTGFPRDLLYLEDDSNIKYENSKYLYYNPDEPFYGSVLKGFPSSIDDKEYEYAMESYIATPDSKNSYVFNLDSLRATERKWLGGIIALRKAAQIDDDEAIPLVELQYRIISDNTSGDIEGRLVYKGEVR